MREYIGIVTDTKPAASDFTFLRELAKLNETNGSLMRKRPIAKDRKSISNDR